MEKCVCKILSAEANSGCGCDFPDTALAQNYDKLQDGLGSVVLLCAQKDFKKY